MPQDTQATNRPRVGVIGAGQLARMLGESASELGVDLCVLATGLDESATSVAAIVVIGSPDDEDAVRALAACCDVVTLDHELVDLDLLTRLIDEGVAVHPSPAALRCASSKDHQRALMAEHGVPVPDFMVFSQWDRDIFEDFCGALGSVPVIKAARGGYDGRGVIIADSLQEAANAAVSILATSPVLVEERLELLGEFAALVVTSTTGERRAWPLVRTVQANGMCVEVDLPSGVDPLLESQGLELAERVADVVGAVGVLAVEMFLTSRGFVLNEVATRPHNSGHWTIEGSTTSQFENHLRAVLGLPLGSTSPVADAATMVNVVGGRAPGSLIDALAIEGAHVHDYGKSWREGRKLGHVTVIGDDADSVRVRAWESASALGTAARMEAL